MNQTIYQGHLVSLTSNPPSKCSQLGQVAILTNANISDSIQLNSFRSHLLDVSGILLDI